MSLAGIGAGADGLLVDVHDDPEHALVDGPQALLPDQFAELMGLVGRFAGTLDKPVGSDLEPSTLHSPFDYYCIQAESALELEEQIAAASALNEAFNLKAEHPRLLALQTRMAIRQGDQENAQNSFGDDCGADGPGCLCNYRS